MNGAGSETQARKMDHIRVALHFCAAFSARPSARPAMTPTNLNYYAALLPRRGRILRRTLSVCLSVRLSVRPVIERYVAPPSELQ